jgi:TATA-box binding protein (TBP) (component of TFIID and TFIIIB)
MAFIPTPLRISTMTVTGHLGQAPDLKRLFQVGAFIPYWWIGEGILKAEFGKEKKGIAKDDILHESSRDKKRFFNQASFVFRSRLQPTTDQGFKEVNIKLFKNGGFQMTGISSEDMARNALQRFMSLNADRGIWPEIPHIQTFNIQMMNSDYSIGKAIRRDRLHKLLVETYGLWSSFEPTIYQGVNTKFFWNKTRTEATPPGICVCPDPCTGSGDGYTIGACKKITISPFRTGTVIITGAKNMEQLMDAYDFLNQVFRDHAGHVLRDELETQPKKKLAPATTTEGVLRQKIRASPRNLIAVGLV